MRNLNENRNDFPEKFDDGIEYYLDLWDKGFKKQANEFIKNFMYHMEASMDTSVWNAQLEDFCREYFDADGYSRLKNQNRGNGNLPYELNRVLWQFLKVKCDQQCMPHMRWICQLYGRYYNPFDQQRAYDSIVILEKAYQHEKCDQKTVDLYFQEHLYYLDWGAHHFPEGCLITKQCYFDIVNIAEKIIKEHTVDKALLDKFYCFTTLYQCYDQYKQENKKRDFYQICKEAGL